MKAEKVRSLSRLELRSFLEHVDVAESAAPGGAHAHALVLLFDEPRRTFEVLLGLLEGK
jgi:hypothetical protein